MGAKGARAQEKGRYSISEAHYVQVLLSARCSTRNAPKQKVQMLPITYYEL